MSTSPIPPVLDQDRYAAYQPTAATTDFALGFPLFGEAADVAVYLNGNLLTLTTDYTVRSVANGASLTPAPVTDAYVRLNAAISSGKLEIYGNFRPRRTIQATAPYGTRDFNFAFSLLMAALREMWSKFTRALKVPVGEEDLTIPSSDDRAGQVLAFDLAGKPVVGGRYAELMASASAAAIAAATASAAATAAAASAAAAATFDPALYSTTAQINTMLADYVPTTRTIASGTGILINGGASATLGSTVTVSLDLPAKALAQAVWTAGVETAEAPISPAKLAATIAALVGSGVMTPKSVQTLLTSGSYTPSAGTKYVIGILDGGGGQGGGGGGGASGGGGGGGGQTIFMAVVDPAVSYPATIGAGGTGGSSNQNGLAGGTTQVTIDGVTYSATGGAGGVKAGTGSGTPGSGGAGGSGTGGMFNFTGNAGGAGVSGTPGVGGTPWLPLDDLSGHGVGGAGLLGGSSGSGSGGTAGAARFLEFKK